jgi:hypothetical protein
MVKSASCRTLYVGRAGVLNIRYQATVHALVDTTVSFREQDTELLQDVYQQVSIILEYHSCYCPILTVVQAALMHPVLRKYEDNWVMYCIVQARLKATSANASAKGAKQVSKEIVAIVENGPQTRSKQKKK